MLHVTFYRSFCIDVFLGVEILYVCPIIIIIFPCPSIRVDAKGYLFHSHVIIYSKMFLLHQMAVPMPKMPCEWSAACYGGLQNYWGTRTLLLGGRRKETSTPSVSFCTRFLGGTDPGVILIWLMLVSFYLFILIIWPNRTYMRLSIISISFSKRKTKAYLFSVKNGRLEEFVPVEDHCDSLIQILLAHEFFVSTNKLRKLFYRHSLVNVDF